MKENSSNSNRYVETNDDDDNDNDLHERSTSIQDSNDNMVTSASRSQWIPSGSWWKDLMYFAGPGWMVSVAYVDPGNYQADIQAGALSRYSLLCIIWWTSLLSIYVQVLCVRLGYYSGMTLSEAQAKYTSPSTTMKYLNWFIAELSTVITDLPEVIGIGIACNVFFGWPYWVGVVSSLLTTMVFLMTLNYSTQVLETILALFVGIMAIALFVEMNFVGVSTSEMFRGWAFGIADFTRKDIFSITGVVGSVVMPHNLYLHTSAVRSRSSQIHEDHVPTAVFWSSIEPIVPVIVSFFINLAVLTIAAERVYGTDNAAKVGLSDFCSYFQSLPSGCFLWAIALLAAGQSSAITTTFTGQYVMDGFLNLQLPIRLRAIVTRLVAITPCIITSVLLPHQLNQMVNFVNAAISFLLPFAFTPLVLLTSSESVMGDHASKGFEKTLLHIFAFAVWLVNAVGLSTPGGGFFGDWREKSSTNAALLILEIIIQMFYAWWNWQCIRTTIVPRRHDMVVPQLEELELSDIDDHELI